MANPSPAWEQVQERHVNQMYAVIGLLRATSRTASIPGEDQNGFSRRAVEEGRRAFYEAVDNIKFDKKTGKANFVLPGVNLEDEEDSDTQVSSADIEDCSIDGHRGSSVYTSYGSLSVENHDSDIVGSEEEEADQGGSVSLGRSSSTEVSSDNNHADLVADITKLQELLGRHKTTAENGGFENRADFIKVFIGQLIEEKGERREGRGGS